MPGVRIVATERETGDVSRNQEEVQMSIFGDIAAAIFGRSTAPGATNIAGTSTAGKPISQADVEAMIETVADGQDEDFEWRESIVDLILTWTVSVTARKQLAKELGYTGALDGSAQMNNWLHSQVMTKLAESGGKVPDSLKHA
jgi:hypothetical protein